MDCSIVCARSIPYESRYPLWQVMASIQGKFVILQNTTKRACDAALVPVALSDTDRATPATKAQPLRGRMARAASQLVV